MLDAVPNVSRVDMSFLSDGEAAPQAPVNAGTSIVANAPALFMFSSGSTGKPKRITRTQEQLLAEYAALASTIGLSEDDRILCSVPLYHAHGFGNCMLASVLSGATLILMEGEFNPREAARLLEAERITIYPAVPFMLKMIGDAFYPTKPDLSGVRLIFTAGAPLPGEVIRRMRDVFSVTPGQLYGSTETGAIAINFDVAPGTEDSVGKPLVGMDIDVLDESGLIVQTGQIGEIAVRSPAMTQCYDDLPEQTRESFQNGYFLPGDLGCKTEDGRIYIKGRKKLLINVAGNKVDPLDVEALINSHPAVSECVVLGCPDPNYGEMVKAVIVTSMDCTESDIVDLCNRHLAWYKVPKRVEFRSEIPRSPLGKILRKYLQDELSEVK
jgi:long-chain acyl-CoA synthetase